jgi:hypothetical protein
MLTGQPVYPHETKITHLNPTLFIVTLHFVPDSSQNNPMDSNQSRLARQDLLRRRDINLYSGLHPRLLHVNNASGLQQPRLSLLARPTNQPCRAFTAGKDKYWIFLENLENLDIFGKGRGRSTLETANLRA